MLNWNRLPSELSLSFSFLASLQQFTRFASVLLLLLLSLSLVFSHFLSLSIYRSFHGLLPSLYVLRSLNRDRQ